LLLQNQEDGFGPFMFTFNSKCLDLAGSGSDNGVSVGQYECSDNATNQRWDMINNDDTVSNQSNEKHNTAYMRNKYV